MITNGAEDAAGTYSAWIGKPVVLLVVVRSCHVPIACRIVAESPADLRVLIDHGWEMDVRKELILHIKAVESAAEPIVN